jgi:Xaa-Pro aminopeptidase
MTVAECQEGESELTLHRRILAAIRQAGGNEGWGRTVAGERRLIPAAMSSERSLQPRDLVTVEYACAFRTYPARIGRMAVVGEPSDDDQQHYDRYVQALESMARQVGPGQSGREIFERTQSTFQAAGFAPRGSTVGNALDIAYYGRPALSPAETLSTRPGMHLNLEPETSDGFKTSLLLEITEDGATRVPDTLPPLEQFLRIPTRS